MVTIGGRRFGSCTMRMVGFYSLAVGLLLQNLLDPEGADWEQVARAGVEMLMYET